MQIFGLTITRTKQASILQPIYGQGGWLPIIREWFTGAWQQNATPLSTEQVLANPTLYACMTLIASDIGKMGLRLMVQDDAGIWTETESPAFSPFLRKPNGYQTRVKFIQWWLMSKLKHGNTYVLKQRDNREVVIAGYILDPCRVQVLVAPDQSVYYELKSDNLAGIDDDVVIVPASEIMHDVMCPLFHPLVGVSPIFAAGYPALLAKNILSNSEMFMGNSAQPGGVLTAPGSISQETADRVKDRWDTGFGGANRGKVAVLGDGLTYKEIQQASAVDLQLIEQLRWTDEQIAKCFHMPLFKVGGPMPPYNSVEAVNQLYYSDCLQSLIEELEAVLDEGLGLAPDKIDGVRYGTEFDRDDLFQMDTATLIKSEKDANGLKTVNESRRRLNLPAIIGGNTVYRQQQDFSIEALNRRDQEQPPPPSITPPSANDQTSKDMPPKEFLAEYRKALVA